MSDQTLRGLIDHFVDTTKVKLKQKGMDGAIFEGTIRQLKGRSSELLDLQVKQVGINTQPELIIELHAH
jgi:hypothetical protein